MLPQCRNCLGVMQVAGNDVDDVVLLAELAQLLRADCHNDLMIKHKEELCARILLRHAANALKILRIVIGLCQRNAVELLQKALSRYGSFGGMLTSMASQPPSM